MQPVLHLDPAIRPATAITALTVPPSPRLAGFDHGLASLLSANNILDGNIISHYKPVHGKRSLTARHPRCPRQAARLVTPQRHPCCLEPRTNGNEPGRDLKGAETAVAARTDRSGNARGLQRRQIEPVQGATTARIGAARSKVKGGDPNSPRQKIRIALSIA